MQQPIKQEPRLKAYVQDIVGTFAQDERVLIWDIYNELEDFSYSNDQSCGTKNTLKFFTADLSIYFSPCLLYLS